MKVICSEEEYINMQKEVCFMMNDLKQITDVLCSTQYTNDFMQQANASYSAQVICDRLKCFLVQMNFISVCKYNEGDVNNGSIDTSDSSNSDILDDTVDTVPEDIEQL